MRYIPCQVFLYRSQRAVKIFLSQNQNFSFGLFEMDGAVICICEMESNEGLGIGQSDAPCLHSSLYICLVRRHIHLFFTLFQREWMRPSIILVLGCWRVYIPPSGMWRDIASYCIDTDYVCRLMRKTWNAQWSVPGNRVTSWIFE